MATAKEELTRLIRDSLRTAPAKKSCASLRYTSWSNTGSLIPMRSAPFQMKKWVVAFGYGRNKLDRRSPTLALRHL